MVFYCVSLRAARHSPVRLQILAPLSADLAALKPEKLFDAAHRFYVLVRNRNRKRSAQFPRMQPKWTFMPDRNSSHTDDGIHEVETNSAPRQLAAAASGRIQRQN